MDSKTVYVQLGNNTLCLETGIGLIFLTQETRIEKEWGMFESIFIKMELNSLLLKFSVLFHANLILVLG